MDKEITKKILKENGTLIAPYVSIKEYQYNNQKKRNEFIQILKNNFSLPIFIKPANCGSSIGIEKLSTFDNLLSSVENAFKYVHTNSNQPFLHLSLGMVGQNSTIEM